MIIQPSLGNKTLSGLTKRVLGLYGVWGTFAKVLELVRRKLMDVGFVAGIRVEPNSIGLLAKRYGCSLLPFIDVNDGRCVAYVKERKIGSDSICLRLEIFQPEILSAPRMGCINLHNGDLPRYKGMMPNFWQMYNGEQNSMLTIHTMSPNLDEGDIVLRKSTPIPKGVSLEELIRDTKINSANTLVEWLARLEQDVGIQTTKMNTSNSRYFGFPSRQDVKEFRRRGHRI